MLSGTSFESTAFYTCEVGFTRNGAKKRKCGSDGSWAGTAPTCDGMMIIIIMNTWMFFSFKPLHKWNNYNKLF